MNFMEGKNILMFILVNIIYVTARRALRVSSEPLYAIVMIHIPGIMKGLIYYSYYSKELLPL